MVLSTSIGFFDFRAIKKPLWGAGSAPASGSRGYPRPVTSALDTIRRQRTIGYPCNIQRKRYSAGVGHVKTIKYGAEHQ
jgi:hypothetical protein